MLFFKAQQKNIKNKRLTQKTQKTFCLKMTKIIAKNFHFVARSQMEKQKIRFRQRRKSWIVIYSWRKA